MEGNMNIPSCANWKQSSSSIACRNEGKSTCAGCHLVLYCSKECQIANWSIHKLDCRSSLRKPNWRPAWESEKRTPHFVKNSPISSSPAPPIGYGGRRKLWGNVPALDLLQLKDNEGLTASQDLSILLAASGDLRNFVKTIASLPDGYTGSLRVDINDKDELVAARNFIILVAAFTFPPKKASNMILHIWYSAFLPGPMARSLHEDILPLIKDFTPFNHENLSGHIMQGRWLCNNSILNANLPQRAWDQVVSCCSGVSNISYDDAVARMRFVTLAHDRRDFRDRAALRLPPSWRLSELKFRKDGVMLPFGASSNSFNTPNPLVIPFPFFEVSTNEDRLFFETPDNAWPMPDSASPLDGWKLSEVLESSYGAKEDIHGLLYFHLKHIILKFCEKLTSFRVHVSLFNMEPEYMPHGVATFRGERQLYDRIEMANISDMAYLGPLKPVALFGPLLKHKQQNQHATLLALFLNATDEMSNVADHIASMGKSMPKVLQFLRVSTMDIVSGNNSTTEVIKMFRDNDVLFERYMQATCFEGIGGYTGLKMKTNQTIVAKWPLRLSENPTQRDFDLLYWSGHTGSECYIEWCRK